VQGTVAGCSWLSTAPAGTKKRIRPVSCGSEMGCWRVLYIHVPPGYGGQEQRDASCWHGLSALRALVHTNGSEGIVVRTRGQVERKRVLVAVPVVHLHRRMRLRLRYSLHINRDVVTVAPTPRVWA
jgi:hypothetical protein